MLIEAIDIIAPSTLWTIRGKIAYVCMTVDNITKIIICTVTRTTYIDRLGNRIALCI